MGMYSDYLLDELEEVAEWVEDEEEERNPPTAEDRRAVEALRSLCQLAIRGKTAWLGRDRARLLALLPGFEAVLDTFEDEVDRTFTELALEGVPGMTARFRRLPSILLMQQPPRHVRTCLLEATRCYLHGLFPAAAVLCRAGAEAALDDRLRAAGASGPAPARAGRRDPVSDRVLGVMRHALEAGVIGPREMEALDRVRRVGNRAAHGGDVSEEQARESVVGMREAIERLYR